jgi:hypothetical protein
MCGLCLSEWSHFGVGKLVRIDVCQLTKDRLSVRLDLSCPFVNSRFIPMLLNLLTGIEGRMEDQSLLFEANGSKSLARKIAAPLYQDLTEFSDLVIAILDDNKLIRKVRSFFMRD